MAKILSSGALGDPSMIYARICASDYNSFNFNGTGLYIYEGKHPSYIVEAGLDQVEDFRYGLSSM